MTALDQRRPRWSAGRWNSRGSEVYSKIGICEKFANLPMKLVSIAIDLPKQGIFIISNHREPFDPVRKTNEDLVKIGIVGINVRNHHLSQDWEKHVSLILMLDFRRP
jgi:hypothetical protein